MIFIFLLATGGGIDSPVSCVCMTLWLRPNPPPSLPAWDYSPPRTLTLVAWEVRGDSTATVAERFGGSSPLPPPNPPPS